MMSPVTLKLETQPLHVTIDLVALADLRMLIYEQVNSGKEVELATPARIERIETVLWRHIQLV